MAGRSPKLRGRRYESELAVYLSTTLGLAVRRTVLCQQIFNKRRGNPDLIGAPLLAVEAKRAESLNFRSAMAQARRNAGPGEIPVVITRRDREPTGHSTVMLSLDDFISLYRKALVHDGYMQDDVSDPGPIPSDPELPF